MALYSRLVLRLLTFQMFRVTPAMEAGLADHVWAVNPLAAPLWRAREPTGCESNAYASRRKTSKEQSRKNSGRPARSSKTCKSVRPKGGAMDDEWTTVISGDRLVKFTYWTFRTGKHF